MKQNMEEMSGTIGYLLDKVADLEGQLSKMEKKCSVVQDYFQINEKFFMNLKKP